MQTWRMEDVPVSDDSRVVYCGRDTAVSSLLSQGPNSSFPVALKRLRSLFFSSLHWKQLCFCFIDNGGA